MALPDPAPPPSVHFALPSTSMALLSGYTTAWLVAWLVLRPHVGSEGIFVYLAVTAAVSLVGWASMWNEVIVGIDGVVLKRRALFRFVPLSDVAKVRTRRAARLGGHHRCHAVELVLHSGEVVRIPTAAGGQQDRVGPKLARAILRRVKLASQAVAIPADLSRGARSGEAWLRALRGGGYRHGHVDDGALRRVLDSPSARPAERAAAALVLDATGDAQARERLLELARAAAHEDIVLALETVSRSERPAAIARALEQLDA